MQPMQTDSMPMPMPMPPAKGGGGGGMHMTMQMTFGARTSGVAFLFDGWTPDTSAGFFASCLLVLLVAAALEVSQRFLPRLERWLVATEPRMAARNSARAVYTVLTSGVSYALMLLSMTFNLYIFASIILGFGLGALLGGQLHERVQLRPRRLAELDVAAAPPAEQVSILRVTGLACSACVVAVESVLRSVKYVSTVSVDLSGGTATVLSRNDAPCPIAEMLEAIQSTGRSATAVVVGAPFAAAPTLEDARFEGGRPPCCR